MANPNPSYKIPKGTTPNPNGRPKSEWTWAGLIRKAMEEKNLDGQEIKDEVARVLVAKALEGDVQAIKELGNRIDGMAKQYVESSGSLEVKNVVQLPSKRPLDPPPKTN